MKLRAVTKKLESLEETIIVQLSERAQLCRNSAVYAPESTSCSEKITSQSLFDLRFYQWERSESLFGRFLRPEERPFNRGLPEPRYGGLPPEETLPELGIPIREYDEVNLTSPIREAYLQLIPRICPEGDDGLYDLSMERDICVLTAVSRRVHFGAFYVGECKYRQEPRIFRTLAEHGDTRELAQRITRKDVEERIMSRVRAKAHRLQRGINRRVRNVVDPEEIVQLYRKTIIPLTKEGEIRYLLRRLTDHLRRPTARGPMDRHPKERSPTKS
jgi:chorismate mutase